MVQQYYGVKHVRSTHATAPSSPYQQITMLSFYTILKLLLLNPQEFGCTRSYIFEQGITVGELSCLHHRNAVTEYSITRKCYYNS